MLKKHILKRDWEAEQWDKDMYRLTSCRINCKVRPVERFYGNFLCKIKLISISISIFQFAIFNWNFENWNWRSGLLTAPSENLVSREFSRFFFNFHFSFSISSHLSFTFNSRKRVKGIYFSLFTSRKKWKLSEFHSFFSRKKSEIRCGVWPDISLSSQIVFF